MALRSSSWLAATAAAAATTTLLLSSATIATSQPPPASRRCVELDGVHEIVIYRDMDCDLSTEVCDRASMHCVRRLAAGAMCGDMARANRASPYAVCATGLWCPSYVVNGDDAATCEAERVLGDQCDPAMGCGKHVALLCVPVQPAKLTDPIDTHGTHVCALPGQEDDKPCVDHRQCAGYCSDSRVCAQLGALQDPCADGRDEVCGYRCDPDSNICVEYKKLGEQCDSSRECCPPGDVDGATGCRCDADTHTCMMSHSVTSTCAGSASSQLVAAESTPPLINHWAEMARCRKFSARSSCNAASGGGCVWCRKSPSPMGHCRWSPPAPGCTLTYSNGNGDGDDTAAPSVTYDGGCGTGAFVTSCDDGGQQYCDLKLGLVASADGGQQQCIEGVRASGTTTAAGANGDTSDAAFPLCVDVCCRTQTCGEWEGRLAGAGQEHVCNAHFEHVVAERSCDAKRVDRSNGDGDGDGDDDGDDAPFDADAVCAAACCEKNVNQTLTSCNNAGDLCDELNAGLVPSPGLFDACMTAKATPKVPACVDVCCEPQQCAVWGAAHNLTESCSHNKNDLVYPRPTGVCAVAAKQGNDQSGDNSAGQTAVKKKDGGDGDDATAAPPSTGVVGCAASCCQTFEEHLLFIHEQQQESREGEDNHLTSGAVTIIVVAVLLLTAAASFTFVWNHGRDSESGGPKLNYMHFLTVDEDKVGYENAA